MDAFTVGVIEGMEKEAAKGHNLLSLILAGSMAAGGLGAASKAKQIRERAAKMFKPPAVQKVVPKPKPPEVLSKVLRPR